MQMQVCRTPMASGLLSPHLLFPRADADKYGSCCVVQAAEH